LKSKPTVTRTATWKPSHCGIPSATLGNWLAHDIDVSLHYRRCEAATLVLIGELIEPARRRLSGAGGREARPLLAVRTPRRRCHRGRSGDAILRCSKDVLRPDN
jgi:hypothetical protein